MLGGMGGNRPSQPGWRGYAGGGASKKKKKEKKKKGFGQL
jgi:signal recognition particle subunit SRP54